MQGWLRLAQVFGSDATLAELQEKWDWPEYLTRMAWLEEQWNEPDRSDHYLMQIAGIIQHLLDKTATSWNPSDFKVPFGTSKDRPYTVEEATNRSKSNWNMMSASPTTGRTRKRHGYKRN